MRPPSAIQIMCTVRNDGAPQAAPQRCNVRDQNALLLMKRTPTLRGRSSAHPKSVKRHRLAGRVGGGGGSNSCSLFLTHKICLRRALIAPAMAIAWAMEHSPAPLGHIDGVPVPPQRAASRCLAASRKSFHAVLAARPGPRSARRLATRSSARLAAGPDGRPRPSSRLGAAAR